MKISVLPLLLLSSLSSVYASNSPPIAAAVRASWPASPLVVQYLETLALEDPTALFPFLDFLASPKPFINSSPPALSQKTRKLLADGTLKPTPDLVFATQLQANETYALLEYALTRSNVLKGKGQRDSLRLALSARESSVVIEGMRLVEEQREKEVIPRPIINGAMEIPGCRSWLDVNGHMICSEEEFWKLVGEEQKEQSGPVIIPASDAPQTQLYAFDHLSPTTRNDSLPLILFYAYPSSSAHSLSPSDGIQSFDKLYAFARSLSYPPSLPTSNPKAAGNGGGGTTKGSPAGPPRLQIALRWGATRNRLRRPFNDEEPQNLVLSGYGAGLDIKKSDYLAIDDRLASSDKAASHLEVEGKDASPKMDPVKKSDIARLGLRATAHILSSDSPLEAFTNVTASFPLLASHLSTLVPTIPEDLEEEVGTFQMTSPLSQRPSFHLNGMPLPESSVDPFALLRIMRRERKFVTDIQGLSSHLSTKQARDVLMHEGIGAAASGGSTSRGRDVALSPEVLGDIFDAGDKQEGGGLILWWNDLEKDKRYKTWSKDLKDMLRPVYPGQMNLIRRNLNSVIFVLDFSQPSALMLLSENIRQFVSRGIPLRFGAVPQVDSVSFEIDVSAKVAQVLWYVVDAVGRVPGMTLLGDLALSGDRVSEPILRRLYEQLAMQSVHISGGPLATFDEVIKGVDVEATAFNSRLSKARAYTKRLAVEREPKALGSFFLDGAHFKLDDDWTRSLQTGLSTHVQFLQQMIYRDLLTDDVDVNRYFFDLPTTHARRNPHIFPSPETNPLKIVNLVDAAKGVHASMVKSTFIEGVSPEQLDDPEAEAPPALATLFIVADIDSPDGRDLAKSALQLVDKTPHTRISLLHNPAHTNLPHSWELSNLIYLLHTVGALEQVLPSELLSWLELEVDYGGPGKAAGTKWTDENPVRQFLRKGANRRDTLKAVEWWTEASKLAQNFGFEKGQNGIVINGRVIGPFEDGAFATTDLKGLVNFELQKRINPVIDAIDASGFNISLLERSQRCNIYSVATSIISEAYLPDPAVGMFGGNSVERRSHYRALQNEHFSFIGPHENGAIFEIAVVVDPATELAQRWAPILQTLASLETVHLRLYFNPSLYLKELPIKRFYQYSFAPELSFDVSTGAEVQPEVRFEGIPEDVLFNFAADLQQSWLAFPKTSVHDLDNIRLADLPSWSRREGVQATFELESIVVEGHAREMPSSQPPRGLQVELLAGSGPASTTEKRGDTIVMSNLGYFQLKAGPGPFRLAIRAGKSSDVYSFESIGAEGWKSGDISKTGDSLLVSTFEGLTLYPRLRRNPGFETVQLLDENEVAPSKGTGLFDRVKSMFPFLTPSNALAVKKQADINIFTVASGLLYERMAFLMMVSVMRHTKSTVKFWFIQNFLSPSFRAFIPHMAQEHGFEYELVTYKWPHWLRAQKEKQRTIWGYKILFLDVLFPLELDRVIFVDSDQIVRTDLKELIDMDIKGAPYAYAPMGADRTEMDGYRFWKTGYWKDHLKGSPYHISALYLVDLDRFRKVAAGDRLRQQYQGLSADPNSLANLDQDLPNNMQSAIPIHTLDKSWLWCETWCSDESLAQAKTIDLCNNPLTHEPKLQRAKRLIPEWTVYDDEIATLARRVAAEESAIGAFGKKADDLEQAVQQEVEGTEFVHEKEGEKEERQERKKDEL